LLNQYDERKISVASIKFELGKKITGSLEREGCTILA